MRRLQLVLPYLLIVAVGTFGFWRLEQQNRTNCQNTLKSRTDAVGVWQYAVDHLAPKSENGRRVLVVVRDYYDGLPTPAGC